MEDQDFWRLSGIFREVYLYSTVASYIQDYSINASLVNDYKDGQLEISTNTVNAEGIVDCYIYDINNTMVYQEACQINNGMAKMSKLFDKPLAWTAETPNLYHVVLVFVITSYSIHYTKLYDVVYPSFSP